MAPVVGTGDTGLTDIISHMGRGGSWSVPVTFLLLTYAWMAQEASYFIILMTHLYSLVYRNQDQ